MHGSILLILSAVFLSLDCNGQRFGQKERIEDSLEFYRQKNKPEKILHFSEKLLAVTRKKKDPNREASLLQTAGDAQRRLGQLDEAEKKLLKSLEIRQGNLGMGSPEAASVHFSLGNLYSRKGNFALAEFHYQKSLEIRKKALGENHPDVAGSCYGLGNLYVTVGNYSEAEHHLLNSLQISLLTAGETDAKLADTYNAIGTLYTDWTRLQEAEKYYLKAIESGKSQSVNLNPNLAYPYNNLGNLYETLGNYEKAKGCFLKSIEITKINLGENHPDVADGYNNLGVMHLEKGEMELAEEFLKKSMEIKIRNLGENHLEIASTHLNLGTLNYIRNAFRKAEWHYQKSLEILNQFLREYHPDRANLYNNLAGVYWKMGNIQKAEFYFLRSLEIYQKTLGDLGKPVVQEKNRLGVLNLDWGRMVESERYFRSYFESELALIQRYFPFLSEGEKEKFLDREKPYLDAFQSFCAERYSSNPAIAALLLDQQLATKGLLLNNSAKWRQEVKSSDDSTIHRLFADWNQSQQQLNRLIQSTDSMERAGIDTVGAKTEKLEKELSLRSASFNRFADRKPVHWEQIRQALKPGQAAVETIRIHKFGVKETQRDSSETGIKERTIRGLTDSIWYAAVVVKPEWNLPEMVFLKNGNDLESKHLKAYRKAIRNFRPDMESYKWFWEKISSTLGTSQTVYFSPDGVFHKINPVTLINPKTGKFLLDEFDFRLVTSLKDILPKSQKAANPNTAVLIGNPRFSNGDTVHVSKDKLDNLDKWPPLPNSKTEIEKVEKLLQTGSWKIKTFQGDSASERTLKSLNRPALLHIATHGFFRSDSSQNLPVLHRSGLVLASDHNLGLPNSENGIHLSAEAMNLNLENTKLVVLSACETGLGEIKNGEGVYGLQRAFKVAGAESILMSLWKVSDEATQELMVSFYKHWLTPGAKKPALRGRAGGNKEIAAHRTPTRELGDKRTAFLKAQKELKTKFPNPFHWGAFVLLGD